jgi:hypothetical protein
LVYKEEENTRLKFINQCYSKKEVFVELTLVVSISGSQAKNEKVISSGGRGPSAAKVFSCSYNASTLSPVYMKNSTTQRSSGGTSYILYVNSVTIPKLCPAPLIAQNKSGLDSAETVRAVALGRTSRADTKLSERSP